MTLVNLFAILIFAVLFLIWLDGARAREMATELAKTLCAKRGFQFLDGTVSMERKALRNTNRGMRMRRMFRFDYSIEGFGRRSGYIILIGTRVEQIQIVNDTSDADGTTIQPETSPKSTVVPFKRK